MTKYKARVYVAGPLTQGDVIRNIAEAISAADKLLRNGYAPYLPHIQHPTWHLLRPHEDNEWLDLDKHWLKCCHAVYRVPGYSPGAEAEEELAGLLSLPVVGRVKVLDGMFGGKK
jgi:hypothetical protein